MELRAYSQADFERIKEIHKRQNFGYPFPDLSDPVFAVGAVAEDSDGLAQAAAFLKVTAEAYLFLDPKQGTPRERWKTLLQIHAQVRLEAERIGFESVTCWIPPNLTKKMSTGQESRFVRRLQSLGWSEDAWRAFSYPIRTAVK